MLPESVNNHKHLYFEVDKYESSISSDSVRGVCIFHATHIVICTAVTDIVFLLLYLG